MKSLTEVLAAHRWVGWLNITIDTPAEDRGDVAIGLCMCDWRGDDWPAHVAAAYREARTVRTVEEAAALPRFTLIEHRGVPMRKNDGAWDSLSTGIRHHEAPLPALVLWVSGEVGA